MNLKEKKQKQKSRIIFGKAKTENKKTKAMKTKNNVQKAIFLKTAAVVVSFVLVSLTVSAQDFWKKLLTNSSFNEIALAMVETTNNPGETETSTDYSYLHALETEVDPVLEVEGWMMDETNFSYLFHTNEIESVLEVEDWMFNESLFELRIIN